MYSQASRRLEYYCFGYGTALMMKLFCYFSQQHVSFAAWSRGPSQWFNVLWVPAFAITRWTGRLLFPSFLQFLLTVCCKSIHFYLFMVLLCLGFILSFMLPSIVYFFIFLFSGISRLSWLMLSKLGRAVGPCHPICC